MESPERALQRGTTPARAGTTGRPDRADPRRWDHPRTRGDHPNIRLRPNAARGPPPHARGPLICTFGYEDDPGTTPARAGTTLGPPGPELERGDHPRTRGDHSSPPLSAMVRTGPPPHARGPPHEGAARDLRVGTTPARAGTTGAPSCGARSAWDHPRTRGDHPVPPSESSGLRGPPPHARGPHPESRRLRAHPGTTPARAGTTVADLRRYRGGSRFLLTSVDARLSVIPCISPSRCIRISPSHAAPLPGNHPYRPPNLRLFDALLQPCRGTSAGVFPGRGA